MKLCNPTDKKVDLIKVKERQSVSKRGSSPCLAQSVGPGSLRYGTAWKQTCFAKYPLYFLYNTL